MALKTLEVWRAEGPEGSAEVFFGDDHLAELASGLPAWGPFPSVRVVEHEGDKG